MILGVDTGGTFTDFVLLAGKELRIHKVLSTPGAPEQAILEGMEALSLNQAQREGRLLVIHGSTVATNAALERKGVRTVFITNRGLKDLLTIGRQARPSLYQLQPEVAAPPVPPELCLETGGRIDHHGALLEPLTTGDLAQLQQQISALQPQAVAINLLYSYIDDQYEKRIEAALPDTLFVSRSSAVLPEYKEYERGIATWLNAWLGPLVSGYVQRLQRAISPSPLTIMQSSGGTMAAEHAAQRAVNMLLSGPAGGLSGARFMGTQVGEQRLISFDMGGTSTDVALIDGAIGLTNEGRIGAWPVAVSMVDMQTIGAGGGSIARLDRGGMLHVGPQSAGADPGPACYGRGGIEATVTDAHVVLGRLRPEYFLGGKMCLDAQAAARAIVPLAETMALTTEAAAEGIIRLANEHMSRALRAISVERGHDPARFTLCCFGGAGGLHICDLAEQLGLRKALIPVHAGVLSALGMLVAPRQRQLARTLLCQLQSVDAATIEAGLQQLAAKGSEQLLQEGIEAELISCRFSLDLRYQGQSFSLNIQWQGTVDAAITAFHQQHQQRYGHVMELAVELVNLRASVSADTRLLTLPTVAVSTTGATSATLYGIEQPVPVLQRDSLRIGAVYAGPMLIIEQVSTTWLKCGWHVRRDTTGNLLLTRNAGHAEEGNRSE
jgi:N-methylhydantoinase A